MTAHTRKLEPGEVVSHDLAQRITAKVDDFKTAPEIRAELLRCLNSIKPKGWVIYHTAEIVDGLPTSYPSGLVRAQARVLCNLEPVKGEPQQRRAKGTLLTHTKVVDGAKIRHWILQKAKSKAFT